ncbi:hypothetical protein SAMN05444266_11122 [Chitinophaga jiangningensis]|uniref:Uncharacterized protein n=1 Tax=Chitinophaga jiangningensis TaxID=1419482 RepID=A0A1M7LL27_9BACT|nr:hypothetical protein [Chitinophaga jiangningensis]SHM78710.1 hypothetical protein SAMN05444266_11122 [Chitinophaga jiangningensis]
MRYVLLLMMLCIGNVVFAQDDSDLKTIQSVFGKEKKALVTQYMDFKNGSNDPFWSLYDQYESDRRSLSRERLAILQDYSRMYETLDDEAATSLAKRTLSNDLSYDKFYQRYFKKFSKVLGGKNAAKFMQLELYLQNAIKSSILNAIPFIGELEKNRDAYPAQRS